MLDGHSQHLTLIEQALTSGLPDNCPEPLKSAMHYAVTAGGKRIRPLLTLLTCEMLGANPEKAIQTACAIEMVHTYSLIHDDLPSMDDDDLRRGQPTLHIQFDEATAILAGDALQSLAFELVSGDPMLTPDEGSGLVFMLAKAIGPNGMVAGQVLDMQAENRQISAEHLTAIHNHKTGDLIATSVSAGARIGGADDDEIQKLQRFGLALGLAFQIRDDLLDVLGTTEELGKPQGSDAEKNKSTFTTIYGVEGAKAHLMQTRDLALESLAPFGNKNESLVGLTHYVVDRFK